MSAASAPTVVRHTGPYESIQQQQLDWVRRSFVATDSLSATDWVTNYFTDDATVRFNDTTLHQRSAILDHFRTFMAGLSLLRHSTSQMLLVGSAGSDEATLLHEYVVEHRVKGDEQVVSNRGVLVAECDVRLERFKQFRVYMDPTALTARFVAASQQGNTQSSSGQSD